MTARVLVVDDHPVFRDGLVAVLAADAEFDVVGAVADGEAAVRAVADGGVDVVLMDLNLPGMSGIEATARIVEQPQPPAVLVVTMVDDDDTVVAALRAGARGYVLKGASGEEIALAVRTVAAGGAVFGAGVAAQVLAVGGASGGGGALPALRDGLTERESQVLQLLATGRSNAQIARDLGLTLKTVQNYVSRILDKLQLADRTQAALYARQDGDGGAPNKRSPASPSPGKM